MDWIEIIFHNNQFSVYQINSYYRFNNLSSPILKLQNPKLFGTYLARKPDPNQCEATDIFIPCTKCSAPPPCVSLQKCYHVDYRVLPHPALSGMFYKFTYHITFLNQVTLNSKTYLVYRFQIRDFDTVKSYSSGCHHIFLQGLLSLFIFIG